MNNQKKRALDAISENAELFCRLSDEIWEYAELSLEEYASAEAYCRVLGELGFKVERELCGIKTAFSGSWGSGRPIIGILGEFDALSGLSQVGGATEERALTEGGNGHGCGHNMLGAGALAAAYGIKKYLEATKKSGTVIFFGTPGEEGGSGKAFMAKDGLWRGLDCALTWHPDDVNEVVTGTCNSCIQALYRFKGRAAHAAANPEQGRSALDAVELMNIGVQYLREHMKDDARIHYSIIDGGGVSPNVVQAHASVLYMVRSVLVKDAKALTERVDDIARGAALMTGTTYEKVFVDGCSNTVPNHVLEKLIYDNFAELGVASHTEEELAFAAALKATYASDNENRLPGIAARHDPAAAEEVARMSDNGRAALNDFLCPLYTGYEFSASSTDVGDVSWQTPTAQLHAVCFAAGSPGHSWQNVSCGRTSVGHKGLISAGRVLAATAIELYESPELLAAARAEFLRAARDGYTSPII